MKRLHALALSLAGLTAVAGNAPIVSSLPDGTEITRYEVQVAPAHFVAYKGPHADLKRTFPKGFPPGIGSGLAFTGKDANGTLHFLGLTDRGPNGDSPEYQVASGKTGASKAFPSPAFHPSLVQIQVRKDGARVTAMKPLVGSKGPVTGLPLPAGLVGSTAETALSEDLRALVPGMDPHGLDPEGVAVDPEDPGVLWLCDEYGPFILKVEARSGKILHTYAPGSGLPSVVAFRQPNRGMEGVAAVGGKVYGIVQSILDLEQAPSPQSTAKARFLRLIELDPKSGATRTFAYPHEVDSYAKSKDAKIGDMVAIGKDRFLVLEQGADKSKAMQNRIYLVDISGATDISALKADGKELEVLSKDAELAAAGVKLARKTLVFDLRMAGSGWVTEKAEGLTVLPDGQTLVVANDNDFGLSVEMTGKDIPTDDPTKYVVLPDGSLTFKGNPVAATYTMGEVDPADRPSRLWLIKLPKPLSQYGQ